MGLTGVQTFLIQVVHLKSFIPFCVYLLLIAFKSVWCKNTKPVSLRPILILYNFCCCVISFITFCGFSYGIWETDKIFAMKPSQVLQPFYTMYWMTKNLELLDTVFMILRHKHRQISFLHVYHHGSMLLLSDYAVHYTPWPAIAPFLAINSFVHVVLYFYYGLTAVFPEHPPQWKKQLTQLQILQFFIDFIHAVNGYLYYGFCIYSIFYGITMTSLFCNFYYMAYIKKSPKKNHVE